jgi:hypothetical protein
MSITWSGKASWRWFPAKEPEAPHHPTPMEHPFQAEEMKIAARDRQNSIFRDIFTSSR